MTYLGVAGLRLLALRRLGEQLTCGRKRDALL